ncbi:MAG: hypothetical protein MUE60_16350 [Candidatus Eisenbacteria bacterium]|nr:hypothetical protein [Candidatus Eisenbacteria bacterium]
MAQRTQADLERQYRERKAQVDRGTMTAEQAYADVDEWLVQLGARQAVLLAPLGQWLWHDHLHRDWVFAGCGVQEGILVVYGKTGGMKRLPQPDAVDDWCIVQVGEQLVGPVRLEEVRRMLASPEPPADVLIWSTLANDWVMPRDPQGQKILGRTEAPKPLPEV